MRSAAHGKLVAATPLVMAAMALGCDAQRTNDYGDQDLHYPPDPMRDAGEHDAGGDAGTCTLTAVTTCTGEPVIDACSSASSQDTATITGTVVVPEGRTPGGSHEARGTLVVLAIPATGSGGLCPNAEGASPPAAFVAVHCADLRAGMRVPFELSGVPVSSVPYNVLPTLDVNGNLELDACDMAGLPRQVMVEKEGTLTLPDALALDLDVQLVARLCQYPACE